MATMTTEFTKSDGVCGGATCIAGHQAPVWFLIRLHQGGMVIDEILQEFPFLLRTQVEDAFRYYREHKEEIMEEAKKHG